MNRVQLSIVYKFLIGTNDTCQESVNCVCGRVQRTPSARAPATLPTKCRCDCLWRLCDAPRQWCTCRRAHSPAPRGPSRTARQCRNTCWTCAIAIRWLSWTKHWSLRSVVAWFCFDLIWLFSFSSWCICELFFYLLLFFEKNVYSCGSIAGHCVRDHVH